MNMRKLIIILIFGIILINPVFAFAESQNQINVKQLEVIIDKRFEEYNIDEILDNKLKEKENNIISAYERTANAFNWFLVGIGFFLGTLVIFTFGYGHYWIQQIKSDAKEIKKIKKRILKKYREIQELSQKSIKRTKEIENNAKEVDIMKKNLQRDLGEQTEGSEDNKKIIEPNIFINEQNT